MRDPNAPPSRALRGRSFRGQALERADFSGADLRWTDFTGADLRSASFRDAQTGAKPWIRAAILTTALAAAVGAGVLTGLAVQSTKGWRASGEFDGVVVAGVVIVALVALIAVTVWRGFGTALKVAAVVYVALVAGTVLANLIWEDVEWQGIARATLVVGALAFGIWAGVVSNLMVGLFGRWGLWAITVLSAIATGDIEGGLAAIALTLSVNYLARRAVRGDARDAELKTLAYHLVHRWGTRFVDADLTGADLRGVDTDECEFTGATLDGVRWEPGHRPSGDVTDDTP
jgi:hypothetical protein